MQQVYDIVNEPKGELLCQLINAVAQLSSYVTMVVRDRSGLGERGTAIISKLRPYLIEQTRSSSWPGTILRNEEATVFRFSCEKGVLEELTRASDGLYSWQQPEFPEDLSFSRKDGTVVLASICHEHDAYLEITDEEYLSLIRSVPGLSSILRQSPPSRQGQNPTS